jgi:hypothetical protein
VLRRSSEPVKLSKSAARQASPYILDRLVEDGSGLHREQPDAPESQVSRPEKPHRKSQSDRATNQAHRDLGAFQDFQQSFKHRRSFRCALRLREQPIP